MKLIDMTVGNAGVISLDELKEQNNSAEKSAPKTATALFIHDMVENWMKHLDMMDKEEFKTKVNTEWIPVAVAQKLRKDANNLKACLKKAEKHALEQMEEIQKLKDDYDRLKKDKDWLEEQIKVFELDLNKLLKLNEGLEARLQIFEELLKNEPSVLLGYVSDLQCYYDYVHGILERLRKEAETCT